MDLEKAQAYSLLKTQAYCILCRHSVEIGSQLSRKNRPPSNWETAAICFLPNDPPQEPPQGPVTAFRADLSNEDWFDPDGIGGGELPHWAVPRPFGGGLLQSSVNFSHVTCLQLAGRISGLFLRGRHLQELARCFRPIIPWEAAPRTLSVEVAPRLPTTDELDLTTDLGLLLDGVSKKLPLELQEMILPRIEGLCRSLLNALTTLDSAKRLGTISEAPKKPSTSSLPPRAQTEGFKLKFVDLLGEYHLARIEPLSSDDICAEAIIPAQPEKPLERVQVAFGAYGVTDLRVVYSDGTYSLWFNGGRNQRFLNLACTDLSQLRVISDGIKIVDVITTVDQSPTDLRVLWDSDELPSPDTQNVALNFGGSKEFTLANGGYRLVNYLPFTVVHSLTMFVWQSGVTCIQINDDVENRIGTPFKNSCAVTHYFREGESLEYLYMITHGSSHQPSFGGSMMVVITTAGRHLYYGTNYYPHRSLVRISDFEFALSSRVTGLFTDAQWHHLYLRSLGATYQSVVESSPEPEVPYQVEPEGQRNEENEIHHAELEGVGPGQAPVQTDDEFEDDNHSFNEYEEQSYNESDVVSEDDSGYRFTIPSPVENLPSSIPGRSTNIIFSSGHLRDVQSLEVQKSGERCVGLKITRDDHTIDVLGQWDPAEHSNIQNLHEMQRDGDLRGLTFVLEEAPNSDKHFVKDILLGVVPDASPSTFVWNRFDKVLAWMFTEDYDHLMPHDVAYTEVIVPRDSAIRPLSVS